jgi:hypothetical protein
VESRIDLRSLEERTLGGLLVEITIFHAAEHDGHPSTTRNKMHVNQEIFNGLGLSIKSGPLSAFCYA